MSLLDRFRRKAPAEERMLTPAQVWGRGGEWQSIFAVTPEDAMQAAIGACVRLLVDDIAPLPVDVFTKVNDQSVPSRRPAWLDFPTGHRWDTWHSHLSEVLVSLLTDGNAYIACAPDSINPSLFRVLDPAKVTVKRRDRAIIYAVSGEGEFDDSQVAHIPWVKLPGALKGINVLDASKESTQLELAARTWAYAFFKNGGTVGTVIKHPGKPSIEEVDIIKASFKRDHQGPDKAWDLGIVTGGADVSNVGAKPEEAALEPLWRHVLEEAARLYHIPPHLLASQDPGGSSFASVEHRSIEYVQHAVVPITARLEAVYSRFLRANTFVKFNVNALMRGDVKTRAEAEAIWLNSRVMRKETVRALEDLPADPNDEGYLDTPNNRTRDPRFEDAGALVRAGFDPAAALVAVGLPPIKHTGAAPVTVQGDDRAPVRDIHVDVPDIRIDAVSPEIRVDAVPDIRVDSVIVSERATEVVTERVSALTERVASDIAETAGQTSADLAQIHADLIEKSDRDRAEVNAALAAMRADLEAERTMPSTRRVLRDDKGRISGVVEERGERTIRRLVERDEKGGVVRIVEAVA